jgi:hypothetical protein
MNGTTALALLAVFASGVFGLLGVVVGVVGTTGTQIFLDMRRERREGDRAKQLVAGELLQAQTIIRGASTFKVIPSVPDVDGVLPTHAWRENRSLLAGHIDVNLWNQLVLAYTGLELDRMRFSAASKMPTPTPLTPEQTDAFKKSARDLGELRRRLWPSGGWSEEIEDQVETAVLKAAGMAP